MKGNPLYFRSIDDYLISAFCLMTTVHGMVEKPVWAQMPVHFISSTSHVSFAIISFSVIESMLYDMYRWVPLHCCYLCDKHNSLKIFMKIQSFCRLSFFVHNASPLEWAVMFILSLGDSFVIVNMKIINFIFQLTITWKPKVCKTRIFQYLGIHFCIYFVIRFPEKNRYPSLYNRSPCWINFHDSCILIFIKPYFNVVILFKQ